jgi:hypothetical protein
MKKWRTSSSRPGQQSQLGEWGKPEVVAANLEEEEVVEG